MNAPTPGPDMPRRSLLRLTGTATAAALGAASVLTLSSSSRHAADAQIPLYSGAVGFTHAGMLAARQALAAGPINGVERALWRPGDAPLIPGTRVREDAFGADSLTDATQRFLAAAALPDAVGPASFPGFDGAAELDRSALLDLHSLTWGLASPVAGWNNNWRYTWPRDTAHVIVALHERGLNQWALGLLAGLGGMQRADGTFHARYVPGTDRAPDARRPQFDGVGWFLWAARAVLGGERAAGNFGTGPGMAGSAELRSALENSASALMAATAGRSRLPNASPDYWEKHEWRLPLSVAALSLSGLEAARDLARAGVVREENAASAAAFEQRRGEVRDAIKRAFGRRGFQRYTHGGGYDAGLLTLLPPYVHEPPNGLVESGAALATVERAFTAMGRPAGGVAPAASWKRDGVSWTPQTTMFAQTFARLGANERADALLAWIFEHRTTEGAISEKVLAGGRPAAVAPLAWPAAVTLSTLGVLARS